jgi:hypothetical protein
MSLLHNQHQLADLHGMSLNLASVLRSARAAVMDGRRDRADLLLSHARVLVQVITTQLGQDPDDDDLRAVVAGV